MEYYYIQINTEENKSLNQSYYTKNHSPFAHPVFKYSFYS